MQWLKDAHVIHTVSHISQIALPLKSHADQNIFKVYFLDVGLLGAMHQVPIQHLIGDQNLFTSFKGSLMENYAVQELTARGLVPLFYWTSAGTAEVDLIIQVEADVLPLEVKAGISAKNKSLKVFGQKYQASRLSRTTPLNLKQDGQIVNYPLYALGLFPRFSR